MELLKLATIWSKSEVFSTRFFIFFAIGFDIAGFLFWRFGKTDLAKAYIYPSLVSGLLLLAIGLGLFYTNKSRIIQFKKEFRTDSTSFYLSEIERTESTLKEYTVVFKVIPILIIIAALLILFIDTPTWRASSITAIAMLIIILLVDGTAHARIEKYNKELKMLDIEIKNE